MIFSNNFCENVASKNSNKMCSSTKRLAYEISVENKNAPWGYYKISNSMNGSTNIIEILVICED